MNVPTSAWFALLADAVQGDAKTELWQCYEAIIEASPSTVPSVQALVEHLVQLYDGGQHARLLVQWRYLKQLKAEPITKFLTRYRKVLGALRAYQWSFSDEQKLHDVSSRIRDWRRVSSHKPKNLDDIAAAVAMLGEGGQEVTVSESQVLLLNEAGTGVVEEASRVSALSKSH